MNKIGYMLLGIILTLFGRWVYERVRLYFRRKKIIESSLAELTELQYKMAIGAYAIRAYFVEVPDDFMDWLLPILNEYDGPEARPKFVERMAKLRDLDEEQRQDVLSYNKNMEADNRVLNLKKYNLHFIEGTSGKMKICPIDFQRYLSQVIGHLEIYNQQVSSASNYYEKTFDSSINGENSKIIEDNLNEEYRNVQERAEIIANII
ncbi:hypothetical protein AKJ51_04885 [candidate division MSBL1 archaeon SCGC-AAA382A20]|uniref:Uncharacterized protein n=1 Tax=candidate division MSBL1 archaeon SCGC-AAA382A20 TaxID=1698280 RepID=A0A133VGW2_9EURY|nr:hypothetical protein AKJ51_04885 [candidate division MSBL1 archaeon SCGC-AAA382A20]